MADFNPALIYDIGLHKGEDTDFYLKKGFSVIGFEANRSLVHHCSIRFQKEIRLGRLTIMEGAIAPPSFGDELSFFQNVGRSEWGTIEQIWAERNERFGFNSKPIRVKRIDMKTVLEVFGTPKYIKIDIEGADRFVLETLRNIGVRPPYLSIESDTRCFYRLQDEFDLLKDLGYRKFKIVQQEGIPGTMLRTTALDGRVFDHVFEWAASGPFGNEIPEPWLTRDQALRQYELIFQRYRWFGDESLFRKLPRPLRDSIGKFYKVITGYRGPLPGWFDTHASA